MSTQILIVDNYDSFVFNIAGYLVELGASVEVVRNDRIAATAALSYDGVLLSPGPGTPQSAGVCMELVGACAGQVPIFGVCLGHQVIAAAYGATVERAPELVHGKTSMVSHLGQGVFRGLDNPVRATRYHSLTVRRETLPPELVVTGWTSSGLVMAVRHTSAAVEGVQFHPESVLTQGGHRMLANWLDTCGDTSAVSRSYGLGPLLAKIS